MTENMITEKQRFSWDYFAEQMEKLAAASSEQQCAGRTKKKIEYEDPT
jgi:hypothetical protein